ncbi:MAG TPA: cytochrome c [Vicinamibacterales bacterium]|nr:cytochrome c [Vicinamibacterales bacterium]
MNWALRWVLAGGVCVASTIAACAGPPPPSSQAGRALYAETGCASCHGRNGRGDGPVAPTVDPPPPDFQNVASFKNGTDVAAIATTIATGILWDPAPLHQGTTDGPYYSGTLGAPNPSASHMRHKQGMPGFAHLSDTERQSLALYVISLDTSARQGARQP